MKYCVNCGKQIADQAVFCTGCGCSTDYGKNIGYDYAPPQIQDSFSPISVTGFVLSFIVAIAGLIVSIIAHNEAKRTGSGKSVGMSKAGIIISSVSMGVAAFFMILILTILAVDVGFY